MGYTDPLPLVVSLLTSNWTAANTDNKTPTIDEIFDMKGFRMDNNRDFILIYQPGPAALRNAGLGRSAKRVEIQVAVDIRTMYSRAHAIKLLNEAARIFDANIIDPGTGYSTLDPDGDWIDLSDKTRGLWRFVLHIRIKNENLSR